MLFTANQEEQTISAPNSTDEVIGFGGAPVHSLDSLKDVARPGDMVFYGINRELARKFGTPNPGAADFIRENTACMLPWTQRHGRTCHDIGVLLSQDSANTLMREAIMLSGTLRRMALHPVLIACDHTASLANALGMIDTDRGFHYVYFDAHFDLGLHSEVAGMQDDSAVQSIGLDNGSFVRSLLEIEQIAGVVNIGGRSWATFDPVYDRIAGFSHITGGSIDTMLAGLAGLKGRPVYVSIDADVLDPSAAPNAACPEPFGMSTRDLLACCVWIGRSCQVLGADLSELVPSGAGLKSEQALMRCLHALFAPG